MRARSIGLAFAALLVLGKIVPSHAQDASPKPVAPSTAPAETPASVPRPAIAPQTAEPAPAATEKPRRMRRHARHHYRRYAHWQPFPIYLPRLHRHGISWHRMRWFF